MNDIEPNKPNRTKLPGTTGLSLTKPKLRMKKLKRLNTLRSSSSGKKGIARIDQLLEELEISFDFPEKDLGTIPKTGPFIVIANHPFGGLDELILLKHFLSIRPDFKVFTTPILQKVGGLEDYLMPGPAFTSIGIQRPTLEQLLQVAHHLHAGGSLGLFPSRNISGYDLQSHSIIDPPWGKTVLMFIRNSKVPVIPFYFKGSNSLFFQLLGFIHSSLQALRLPAELLNKKRSSIAIRIGHPIAAKDQEEFRDLSRYGRYLRAKIYALGTSLDDKKNMTSGDLNTQEAEEIIPPVPVECLQAEIDQLEKQYELFEVGSFKVFCAPAAAIPQIITEIGRLRELTFRQIGEGTNMKTDTDEYDIYYQHLFIWDHEAGKIVGAYRIGMGADIFEEYGIRGFYIFSLFRISKGFFPVMSSAIELGRSFIVSEYQRKPLSLFCLWKGILLFVINHPEYRYLIGPVSISNRFSDFSRSLMIKYIRQHYFDHHWAKYVIPRNAFISDTGDVDVEILLEGSKDLGKFDKHIREVNTENIGLPVLLKKYLDINGKIIAFNIDPKFNDACDGLIVIDLLNIPIQVLTSLTKDMSDEPSLERLKNNHHKHTKNHG